MASSGTNPLADRISGLNINASSAKTAPQGQSPDKEKATAASTDGLKPTASQSEGKENAGGPAEDTTTDAENVLDTGDLEVELNTTLARLQDDENSPLFSVKNFSELGLRQELLQALSLMDYRKPSKIQEKALPLLMHNPPMNMIAQAPSGTGKSAAFVLNMLSRISLEGEMKDIPQGLVLAPTRELATQLYTVAQTIGQRLPDLKIHLAIPDAGRTLQLGTTPHPASRQVQASVIVGTPGTIINRIKRQQMRVDRLKVLVLDEADKMLSQDGSGDDCTRIRGMLPRKMQFVLFSATMADHVREYANKYAPDANFLSLANSAAELLPDTIAQTSIDCDDASTKPEVLGKLYSLLTIGSSIVFVKSRQAAAELENQLSRQGHVVARLTGELEGGERDVVINKFRNLEAKVLIATDVLSRGIDIPTVNMVVNYDIPDITPPGSNTRYPNYDTYLHRIGRTGRFGRIGIALSFVAGREDFLLLDDISKRYGTELIHLATSDWDGMERSLKTILKSQRASANFK